MTEQLIKFGVEKAMTGVENTAKSALGIGNVGGDAAGNAGLITSNTGLMASLNALTVAMGGTIPATVANTTATVANATATGASTVSTDAVGASTLANTISTIANTVATDAAAIAHVFGFATGTPYVQKTGLAVIHQGEAIIPDHLNPFSAMGMSSFDIGAWDIPGDMPSLIHRNELVMPAAQAGAFRDMLSNNATGGASGGDLHTHSHFHIQSTDAAGFEKQLHNNSDAVLHAITHAARNGGRAALRKMARGM